MLAKRCKQALPTAQARKTPSGTHPISNGSRPASNLLASTPEESDNTANTFHTLIAEVHEQTHKRYECVARLHAEDRGAMGAA